MSSRGEREAEAEARRLLYRRLTYVGVLLAAVAVGVWFVRWVSRDLGVNKIGEHYKQVDKVEEP